MILDLNKKVYKKKSYKHIRLSSLSRLARLASLIKHIRKSHFQILKEKHKNECCLISQKGCRSGLVGYRIKPFTVIFIDNLTGDIVEYY